MTMAITQYSAIVMYGLPMDTTAAGLWGGMFVMTTGVVIIKRHNVMVLVFSILSAMSGLIMIALYIWSMSLYGKIISSGYTCDQTNYMGYSICSRIALDSLFLIYGAAAVGMNTILIHDAKWIEPKNRNGLANTSTAIHTDVPVVVTITRNDTQHDQLTRCV
ncbi:Uncharacterized protein APZ42_020581 [Daphnia magna]|uniref:Uncharacterized protein n=1 Tax=Daphnia magna TaxID=35525 RepID=A0A164X799_9CRUS|nr:Uncharacterized protein APZ42_020581 [Daphnia magna]